MTQVFALTTPLMRRTVGFDRFNELFERILDDSANNGNDNYPPYNIEKIGDDEYKITMAVSGFTADDINIVLNDNELSIAGSVKRQDEKSKSDKDSVFLHRGIAMRSFERMFSLADYIKVVGAEMKDGLLIINLEREVPEEKKPRIIPIGTDSRKSIKDKSQKSR